MCRSSWRYVKYELRNLSTGHGTSRFTFRALILLSVFGLVIMIATLQFCPVDNYNSLISERDEQQPEIINLPEIINNRSAMEPLIDRREQTEQDLIRQIESQLPSLPLAYWRMTSSQRAKPIVYRGNEKTINKTSKKMIPAKSSKDTNGKEDNATNDCVPQFPSLFDLQFNNIYWQTLRTSDGTFQLFGAYYDVREMTGSGPLIRILGVIDRINPRVKTHCQMWFDDDEEAVIVETLEYKYTWETDPDGKEQVIYHPYLITCVVPKSHLGRESPASVSLVENACDTSSNNIRVIYNKPDVKRGIGVCVKGLDILHVDLSIRLIEWIELLSLLGAEKIHFYELHVHPNVSKVLDYYTSLGKVDVTPLTLPGGQPNFPALQHIYINNRKQNKRKNELVPYHDCFYKHMYEYEYIALLDIDEVIMPLRDSTWTELIKRVLPMAIADLNVARASYNVRNAYFRDRHFREHGYDPRFPRYMYMLQHVYRAENITEPPAAMKSFHNTERVLTIRNHFPMTCLGGFCHKYWIDAEDAVMHHYRTDCNKLGTGCYRPSEKNVKDTTIWRWKDQLIERVTDTLERLGFFSKKNGLT